MLRSVLERFRVHLEESGLIPPGARVLAGYSGGPDSTCLVHLLHAAGVDVAAAHLHHGQRDEADDELERCREFCDRLGIPFVAGRADVPRMAKDLGMGLEEAGRTARYRFFDEALRQTDSHLIATGHTRTDHVETVLLHLVRGSGLSGLGGVPERRGPIVRPLLIFDRSETAAYCREHGLPVHDDPANSTLTFARARIRLRVLPELEAINPAVAASVVRMAAMARAEDEFLDSAAAALLEQCEVRQNGELYFLTQDCEIAFDRRKLTHCPSVLFRRAIRLATRAVGQALDYHQTETVEQGMRESGRGAVTADGGEVVVEWDDQFATIRQINPVQSYRYPLATPGVTESEEFGWRFAARLGKADPESQMRASMEAILATEAIQGSLYFRSAEAGDTIQPLGFAHRRKVADLMSEFGLTLLARKRLPIVCDLVGPVWIPGVCLSNRVQLKAHAPDALFLEFGPIAPAAPKSETTGGVEA